MIIVNHHIPTAHHLNGHTLDLNVDAFCTCDAFNATWDVLRSDEEFAINLLSENVTALSLEGVRLAIKGCVVGITYCLAVCCRTKTNNITTNMLSIRF